MSKENNKSHQLCGPDCRYRSLYAGSQTSLADMAHRQAQALSRVGRLRQGVLQSMRRNFAKSFQEAERALGHRLNESDDEVLLAYLGHILAASPSATPLIPDGLEELRDAIFSLGVNLPAGTDLASWAEAVNAHNNSSDMMSSDLSELFGMDFEVTPDAAGSEKAKKENDKEKQEAQENKESKSRRPLNSLRKSLQSLSSEDAKLKEAINAAVSAPDFEPKKPVKKVTQSDTNLKASDVIKEKVDNSFKHLDTPPFATFDEVNSLPPADPYSASDELEDELPFPQAGLTPTLSEAAQDDLASLFNENEEENVQEKPLSKAAARRKRKNLNAAQAKQQTNNNEPEVTLERLNKVPQEAVSSWTRPVSKPESNEPEINLPDMSEPEINLPEETSAPAPVDKHKAAHVIEMAKAAPPQEIIEEEKTVLPTVLPQQQPLSAVLKPEFFPVATKKTTRARRAVKKEIRAHAAVPDSALYDVPAEQQLESGAVLTNEIRDAMLASVCIPRPVFTSDLLGVAGSQELLDAWESECRASTQTPVRFIAAKTRHRQRGSLALPYDFYKDIAAESKRSVWADCMDRYRGAVLYEIAVLLHRVEEEVVSFKTDDDFLTLRLKTRTGLAGIVVPLTEKFNAGEITRAKMAAELDSLLSERLNIIAVLAPRNQSIEAMCNAVTEEKEARRWAPTVPVVADFTWDYAQNRGATSKVLMGA